MFERSRSKGFIRKSRVTSAIPDSSLADMAFLLLIFFMVTTNFPKEKPIRLDFPEADATTRLEEHRRDILHVYLERDGRVFINDREVPIEEVAAVVRPLYLEREERLMTILKADREVPYLFVNAIQEELARAGAVRLTFYTDLEERVRREGR